MKKIFFVLICLICSVYLNSQNLSDSVEYNKGLNLIATASSVQGYENAGDYFVNLFPDKQNEWLAPLYASLSYLLASFKETDRKLKDELCDTAQVYINIAGQRHANVSELASVQAFLYQARIDVSPMERGLDYSLKADDEIKKAKAANPNNPRPYFLYAMNVYYTPKMFGGGPEKALPLFLEANKKFDSFSPALPFMPDWGSRQNQDMIEKCKKEID